MAIDKEVTAALMRLSKKFNAKRPLSEVELWVARGEFTNDMECLQLYIHGSERKLPFETHWQAYLLGWDWARYWAQREPDADGRAGFAELLAKYEAGGAEFAALALEHLRKHRERRAANV